MEPLKLPELARVGLLDLYQKAKSAELLYTTALNSAVAALGLDPRHTHQVNLDTGDITPTKHEQEAP